MSSAFAQWRGLSEAERTRQLEMLRGSGYTLAADVLEAVGRWRVVDTALAATATLAEARQWMRDEFARQLSRKKVAECRCPLCERRVARERRAMHHSQARALIKAVREVEADTWFHAPTVLGGSGVAEWSKLRHWGLVEQAPQDGTGPGRTDGMWRVTPLGRDFACDCTTVLSHLVNYVGGQGGTSLEGEQVTIRDVLGKHFDYDELMRGE